MLESEYLPVSSAIESKAEDWSTLILLPVSYTHLDVYKRQAITYAAQKANMSTYNVSSFPKKMSAFEQFFKGMDEDQISTRIIKPVSYTHLDVYKRQDQMLRHILKFIKIWKNFSVTYWQI